MKRNAKGGLLVLPLLTWLSLATASADTIDFTLTNPTQTVSPGSELTFSSTISAPLSNSAAIYLNGDTHNINGPSTISLDDSPFFLNFPLFINPGASATDVPFTVSVPASVLAGQYIGFFTLEGGPNDGALAVLESNPFTVDVSSGPPASIPEPAAWLLSASGLFGVAALLYRAHRDF